jgi:hypothetical protein
VRSSGRSLSAKLKENVTCNRPSLKARAHDAGRLAHALA